MTTQRPNKTELVLESVQRLKEIAEGIQGPSRPLLDAEIARLRGIVEEKEGRER